MPCRSSRHSVICSGNYPASILQREFKEWVIIWKHTLPLIFIYSRVFFKSVQKNIRQLLPVQEDFVQRFSQSIRNREFLMGEIPEVIQPCSRSSAGHYPICTPQQTLSSSSFPFCLPPYTLGSIMHNFSDSRGRTSRNIMPLLKKYKCG